MPCSVGIVFHLEGIVTTGNMSDTKLFIPLLLGTNRKDRQSEHVANWVYGKMQERDEIMSQMFDVRDFDLPRDNYGTEIGELFPDWRDAVIRADGLVIVTPEYNHSYPGILKSVLDTLLKEYIHKAVAFVGVSAGPWGGTRVIESMVPMVRELGLAVTFTDLHFPRVKTKFGENGELLDDVYEDRVQGFLDELVWMATSLRWGRMNAASKHGS
jgi:NAD(P)H-dependent FMN reductase